MLEKTYADAKGCVCDLEGDTKNSNEEEKSDEKREKDSSENTGENQNEVDQFEDGEERKGAD